MKYIKVLKQNLHNDAHSVCLIVAKDIQLVSQELREQGQPLITWIKLRGQPAIAVSESPADIYEKLVEVS